MKSSEKYVSGLSIRVGDRLLARDQANRKYLKCPLLNCFKFWPVTLLAARVCVYTYAAVELIPTDVNEIFC